MVKRVAMALAVVIAGAAVASAQSSTSTTRGQSTTTTQRPPTTVSGEGDTRPATTTINGDTGLWFVAEGDGAVVGAAIGVVRLGIGWVAEVGVLDEWRGRGIGAALTARLMREFSDRGQSKVGLNVDPLNETGAKRLYERLGFTQDRRIDFYELRL